MSEEKTRGEWLWERETRKGGLQIKNGSELQLMDTTQLGCEKWRGGGVQRGPHFRNWGDSPLPPPPTSSDITK